MNILRKSALARWNKDLNKNLSRIPTDNVSLVKKSALCGFLAGDGSVQVRKEKKEHKYYRHQVDFFPDDEEMLDTYLSFVKDIYNLSQSIRIRYNVYQVRLSQRHIIYDLLKLCKFGVYTWSFPTKLFEIKGAKEAWLRAFFSAEGYVGKKCVKIQSVNIKSIKKIKDMLKEFNINSNYFEYTPSNTNHSKVGMIFICDRKSRIAFQKKIGFWHERKTNKLNETLGL